MARNRLEPITQADAAAAKQKLLRKYKLPSFVLFAGGCALMLGLYNSWLDPAYTDAWLLSGAGLLVVAAGAGRIWAVSRMVGYRITRRNAELGWLAVGPAAGASLCLVGWGAVSAVQAMGIDGTRSIGVGIIVAAIGAAVVVLKLYARWSALFLADADGVALPANRVLIGWDRVARVVIADGTAPGTVEIGVGALPGVPVPPMPAQPGQVLTDLPVRVVVPAAKFDLDRAKWALNQSGRADIALVARDAGGERLVGMANRWHESATS